MGHRRDAIGVILTLSRTHGRMGAAVVLAEMLAEGDEDE